MKPRIDDSTLENPVTQFVVREAVSAALESPLREPILEAVDDGADEPAPRETRAAPGGSRLTTLAQGLTVFAVMFVAMYVALRRLTGGEN